MCAGAALCDGVATAPPTLRGTGAARAAAAPSSWEHPPPRALHAGADRGAGAAPLPVIACNATNVTRAWKFSNPSINWMAPTACMTDSSCATSSVSCALVLPGTEVLLLMDYNASFLYAAYCRNDTSTCVGPANDLHSSRVGVSWYPPLQAAPSDKFVCLEKADCPPNPVNLEYEYHCRLRLPEQRPNFKYCTCMLRWCCARCVTGLRLRVRARRVPRLARILQRNRQVLRK